MPDKYHFGCGSKHLPGYINCDSYKWPGVDLVVDLTEPDIKNASEIFSNAFFEHLYIMDRHRHLENTLESLAPNGIICHLGIPWFPGVARAYLERLPGTLPGTTFDIYQAYRYTHGSPENAGYDYISQLHKGLFDEEEYTDMLMRAGVTKSKVFTYAYPGEPRETIVTSGMYITNADLDEEDLGWNVCEYLRHWDGIFIDYESIRFIV